MSQSEVSGRRPNDDDPARPSNWAGFLTAVAMIVVVWTVVLPQISRLEWVESRHRFLRDRGIDPSAMFYTELDAMEPILERLESSSPAEPGE